MQRTALAIGYGFLIVSAVANFLFAFSLGRTFYLALVYGSVGVLATLANAVVPLRMLQAWDARRLSVLVAGSVLLPLCIAFSLASAMGFAATMRDKGTADQAALSANYKTTLAQLKDAEAKSRTPPNEKRIEVLRNNVKTYREQGAMRSDDPQSAALEMLGIVDGRYWLTLLFALLVEAGAGLGLFIALADTEPVSKPAAQWRPRSA